MGPRRLIWLGIAPSVVAHVLVLFGLYLLPEREEEVEEAECPTREERCRARCEGREIDVPTRCPPLEPCALLTAGGVTIGFVGENFGLTNVGVDFDGVELRLPRRQWDGKGCVPSELRVACRQGCEAGAGATPQPIL